MRIAKRLIAAATGSALLVAGLAVVAPSATAITYLENGVAIRSGPYTTGTTIYGRGYPGQVISTAAGGVYGSTYSYSNSHYGSGTSNVWSYHHNSTTGVSGYSGIYFIN
jgi:hypothetical protein